MSQNKSQREKRKFHIRKRVFGTSERPRLTVFRSNRYLYAQIIDDVSQKTLVSANSLKDSAKLNKACAKTVGQTLADKAKENKIEKVVFDRNGYKYHGIVKELADSVRAAGLKF